MFIDKLINFLRIDSSAINIDAPLPRVEKQLSEISKGTSADTAKAQLQQAAFHVEQASAGWPNVAVNFLNDLKDHISATDLPFTPLQISINDSTKGSPEVDWEINNKRYFAIWVTQKRASKATTKMGLYSAYVKRDPDFRTLCDVIAGTKELLNSDGQVEISGRIYEFVSDGCLGFETGKRIEIVTLIQPDFFQSIRKDFIEFCSKVWPVIKELV